MKPLSALLLPCLLTLLATDAESQTGAGVANYRVTFDAAWSPASHPTAFPAGAHFSPLIGATHSASTHLWSMGTVATDGIEVMAETGAPGPLAAEIAVAILGGVAGEVIQGDGSASTDSVSTTFTVTDEFPLVSLTTMIAPSPDWFLGVDSLSMFEAGAWVDKKVVSLFAYDSGTDSGTQFTSANQNTNPEQLIHMITTGVLAGALPMGTFTFERLSSSIEIGICNNPEGSLSLSGSPTLGQTLTFALQDPIGNLSQPSATFLGISLVGVAGLPCGVAVPGLGLAGSGATGDLILGNLFQVIPGAAWNGTPVPFSVPIPNVPALVGLNVYFQGALISPMAEIGATSGFQVTIGA